MTLKDLVLPAVIGTAPIVFAVAADPVAIKAVFAIGSLCLALLTYFAKASWERVVEATDRNTDAITGIQSTLLVMRSEVTTRVEEHGRKIDAMEEALRELEQRRIRA